MIHSTPIIVVNKDKATLSQDLYIYRNNKNITIKFAIVNNIWTFSRSDSDSILDIVDPSFFTLRWMKNNEIKKVFENQPVKDGKANFTIENELTDEDVEMGDYDFQITLMDENKESVLSIPPVMGQLHIKSHIFELGEETVSNTVGYALADKAKVTSKGTPLDVFDVDGNYIKTTWLTGDIITKEKLNKIEEGIYKNTNDIKANKSASNISIIDTGNYFTSDNLEEVLQEAGAQFNTIARKTIVEDGKLYLLQEDGTKIDTGTTLPTGGSGTGTDGTDGREIELQKNDTHIQWRYVGDSSWTNLVALSDITGNDGKGISGLSKTNTTGLVDTYTITFTDKSTTTFTVTNGAKGDTGTTPNLAIGTVTTLESGSNATASITGSTTNPILNLGIPKGKDGSSGGTSPSPSIIYYNIKDFGAVGDGVTDDTSAIQTVLDKAITEKSVKVFIPNGTYKIKRLRLRKNTEIQMDQEAILLRNRDVATTETCPLFLNGEKGNNNYATGWNGDGNIKIQGGTINGNWKVGDQSGIAYGQTFAFGHAQNIQLLDIKFIDGANGDHVIDFSGCKDIYIDRCKFLGTHGVGRITEVIQLDYITTGSFPHFGSNDSTPTENVLIQNCYFSPNYDNADSICNISIGSHSAQHPHPSKNITFRKNIIVDSYAEAVKIVHSVNVDIYNNDIYYTKKNDCTNVILITTESSTNEYFEKSDYINIEKNIIHDLDSSSLHGVINIGSPSSDTTKQSVAVNIRNNVFRNISTTKNISSYRDRIKCISYSSIFNSVVEGNVFENIPNCTCIDLSNCKNLNICKNYAYNVSNLISQFNLGTSSSCLTIDSNRAYNLSDCMFGFYDNYGNRINSYFTISNSITDSEKIINLNKCSNFNIVNNLCQNSIIEMQGCDGFKICNNILKTMSSEYVNEFNPLNNMIISYNTFTYIYDMRHYINSVFSNNIIKNNENSFNVVGANNFKICDNTIMYDLTGNNLTSAVYANRSDVTKLFYLNNNIFKSNNDYTFKYIVEVQSGTLAYCFNNDLPNTVGTGYYVNAKDGYITYNNKNKYLICVNSDGSISSIKINN